MPLLALDDTDTPRGGCTTHTALRIAHAVAQAGGALRDWGLVAPARLVRLNPAAEHRTRGNGALVLPVGPRRGDDTSPRYRVGTWNDGSPIRVGTAPPAGRPTPANVVEALRHVVQRLLPPPANDETDPQPAALLFDEAPDALLYQQAVSRTITARHAWRQAPPGFHRLTPPGRRGETGALAAAAWPADATTTIPRRMSWEYTGYRRPEDRSANRILPDGFDRLISQLPGGFDNLDRETGRVRAVPRTPCPVRFAVRGLDPLALVAHLDPLAKPLGGWLLLTNQATGDHARYARAVPAAHAVVRAPVQITGSPRSTRGGHVFVAARTEDGRPLTLAAFEPTKSLRRALQKTARGDRLTVLARTGYEAARLALEAFRVDQAPPRLVPAGNPRCGRCTAAMKSRGRGAGYRCPRCRQKASADQRPVRLVPSALPEGDRFQVPDHVRGHLLPPMNGLGGALGLDGAARLPVPGVLYGDSRPARRVRPMPPATA